MDEINNQQKEQVVAVLGLNHLTASVELRDKAFYNEKEAQKFSKAILQSNYCAESIVLSTCNRSEIYILTENPDELKNFLKEEWAKDKNIDSKDLSEHSYFFQGMEAVSHLFRVISSLDSLVVGENQIFGQIKEAYQSAVKNDTVDFYFNFLFQASFTVGKRVRTETTLNEGAVSISFAAVELAKKVMGQNLKDKVVGVIGSGEMGELTASHFRKVGVKKFVFFNRSIGSAEKLAAEYQGESYPLSEMSEKLFLCDIIVSSTGANDVVLEKEQVELAHKNRNGESIFLIDIAAPRDIADSVQEIPNTFLFTIDDLKKVVGENVALRQEAALQAEKIIHEETGKVKVWYDNLHLVPIIKSIRQKFESIWEEEKGKLSPKLSEEARQEIERSGQRLLNKLLHIPISGLKELGETGRSRQASHYANMIFSLTNSINSDNKKK